MRVQCYEKLWVGFMSITKGWQKRKEAKRNRKERCKTEKRVPKTEVKPTKPKDDD